MARLTPSADRIADAIAAGISSGQYPPGSALPPMSAFQVQEGVCRSTVQRAFRILGDRGLVNGLQGKAMYVSEAPAPIQQVSGRGQGSLYVISFTDAITKVGRSVQPNVRILAHVAEAARRGAQVSQLWQSPPQPRAKWIENQLIAFARQRFLMAPAGREYFRNADFDQLVGFVKNLIDVDEESLFGLLAA